MKIALVDSGVSYDSEMVTEIRRYSSTKERDESGHGTMCFNIIKKTCNPNVEVMLINILDRNGTSKLSVLEMALNDLLNTDVDLICMSFAFAECKAGNKLIKRIENICKKLFMHGICIVSSYANNYYHNSLPADFHCVLGVEGAVFSETNEYWYNQNKREIVADCSPVIVRNHRNERKVFSGNSKANALICRIILDQFSEKGKILLNLFKNSKKNIWDDRELERTIENLFVNKKNTNKRYFNKRYFDEIYKLSRFFPHCRSGNFYSQSEKIDLDFYLRLGECEQIIKLIENYFDKKVDEDKISIIDFTNIYFLCEALETRWLVS